MQVQTLAVDREIWLVWVAGGDLFESHDLLDRTRHDTILVHVDKGSLRQVLGQTRLSSKCRRVGIFAQAVECRCCIGWFIGTRRVQVRRKLARHRQIPQNDACEIIFSLRQTQESRAAYRRRAQCPAHLLDRSQWLDRLDLADPIVRRSRRMLVARSENCALANKTASAD